MEQLQVVSAYLFGNVKFIDLLAILMVIDIITGITCAIKEKRLRSRKALWGYAGKIGVFAIIIIANFIDVILDLKGMVTYGTVLFYIGNEGLSIVENLSKIGVKIPSVITDKLHVVQEKESEKK